MAPSPTQRLLDLADAYEQKAQALRLAAAELNGHLKTLSTATIAQKLRAAGALRGEVTETPRPQRMKERRELVRELLADGEPHKTSDLHATLTERGFAVDKATVLSDVRALGARKAGKLNLAVWTLSNGHHPPTRVAKAKAAPAPKHKRKKGVRGGPHWQKRQAQRHESAKLLARIAASDKPVSKNLGRSIGALLRRGYVEKTPDGYIRTDKAFTI